MILLQKSNVEIKFVFIAQFFLAPRMIIIFGADKHFTAVGWCCRSCCCISVVSSDAFEFGVPVTSMNFAETHEQYGPMCKELRIHQTQFGK